MQTNPRRALQAMTDPIARVTFVTSHFHSLQGLRLVPSGIWILLVVLGGYEWTPWANIPSGGSGRSELLITVAMVALYVAIGWYYRYHYGVTQRSEWSTQQVGRGLLIAVCILLAIGIDSYRLLPVDATGLTFAGVVAYPGIRDPRRFGYLIGGALLSIQPLNHFLFDDALLLDLAILGWMYGLGFLVIGLVDHVLLKKELRQIRWEIAHHG